MECLQGYIGLRGCGIATPLSGRYINSLPGISLRAIDNLANSEKVTYIKVWEAIQERAIADFTTKVTSKFAERYRLKKILECIDLGEQIETTNNQTAADALYRGFTYELKIQGNTWSKPSALQMVYVQRMKVYLKAAGDFVIKIYDLDLRKELYTKSVTGGVEGWNYVNVNQCFNGYRLFFASNVASEIPYQELNNYSINNFSNCLYSIFGMDCSGYIRGAQSAAGNVYSVTQGNNTFGLSAEFSLLCSFNNVVCSNLKVFELAYWYKLGMETMVERLSSSRVNLTTIDTQEAEDLQNYYMNKFNEELDLAIGGIDLDTSDACIECDAPLRVVESRM